MHTSLSFIRTFFLLLSILFFTTYTTTHLAGGLSLFNSLVGVLTGLAIGISLIGIEFIFKSLNLKIFNVTVLGLFCGYLMGEAIWLVFNTLIDFTHTKLTLEAIQLFKISIFLFSCYLGMTIALKASEELYVSIPFIKLKPISHKKKDLLIDTSILMDSRIIDLASTGLLDHNLVLPRFVLKELYALSESFDEQEKHKGKRCLEVYKKLENLPALDLRYTDNDFPEVKDSMAKLIKLARLTDANIITADQNRVQQSIVEGIRIINIHSLSNALKPITNSGEYINIKIQRYGKEARQGVGYLDDGTMVVINGGAEFIGDTIKAQVLSVKHTSSGRMIFCNATDETLLSDQESAQAVADLENNHKAFLTMSEKELCQKY